MQKISRLTLPHAESGLHRLIREWGLTFPMDITLFNKGILFCPMLKPRTWMQYLLSQKPGILLGGFKTSHFAVDDFVSAFWQGYKYEDPDHEVFRVHPDRLHRCVPYCIYTDEGRGLRKAPVQVVALETLWNVSTFKHCEERARKGGGWTKETFWAAADHTCRGKSLTSRLLIYALPHTAYKGKKKAHFWYDAFNAVTDDLASLFTEGIHLDGGETWFPILVGVKGDAPALAKVGRLTRTFTHGPRPDWHVPSLPRRQARPELGGHVRCSGMEGDSASGEALETSQALLCRPHPLQRRCTRESFPI